jgi:hypothetical protein
MVAMVSTSSCWSNFENVKCAGWQRSTQRAFGAKCCISIAHEVMKLWKDWVSLDDSITSQTGQSSLPAAAALEADRAYQMQLVCHGVAE